MRLQILEHFLNQEVEVYLKTRKTITGILRMSELDVGALEIEPTDSYQIERRGATILMADDVITICPLKPRKKDMCEDCKEECCDEEPECPI